MEFILRNDLPSSIIRFADSVYDREFTKPIPHHDLSTGSHHPNEQYGHQFGHAANYGGSTPEGQRVPLHLLLRLDTNDVHVPLESSIQYLPLFYPFRYEESHTGIQYAISGNESISIFTSLKNEKVCGGENLEFPHQLPCTPIEIHALKYRELRAFLSELNYDYYLTDPDYQYDLSVLEHLNAAQMILIGTNVRPGGIWWTCQNPDCIHHGTAVLGITFAKLADSFTPSLRIWQEGFVPISKHTYFTWLPCCKSIVGNRE